MEKPDNESRRKFLERAAALGAGIGAGVIGHQGYEAVQGVKRLHRELSKTVKGIDTVNEKLEQIEILNYLRNQWSVIPRSEALELPNGDTILTKGLRIRLYRIAGEIDAPRAVEIGEDHMEQWRLREHGNESDLKLQILQAVFTNEKELPGSPESTFESKKYWFRKSPDGSVSVEKQP